MYLQAADVDVGLEDVGELGAHPGVGAIGADHEVPVTPRRQPIHLRLEAQLHAERAGAGLQDVEQPPPADAAEAVAARTHHLAAVVHRDVVPVHERPADGGSALGVVLRGCRASRWTARRPSRTCRRAGCAPPRPSRAPADAASSRWPDRGRPGRRRDMPRASPTLTESGTAWQHPAGYCKFEIFKPEGNRVPSRFVPGRPRIMCGRWSPRCP